jgi:hypothetical protein
MAVLTNPAATAEQRELSHTLITAASLMAAAALVDRAGTADVSITVHGTDINVQVPTHNGDEPSRSDTVAAYALVLDVPVLRKPGTQHTWIEAYGIIGAHRVHVWTIADPATVVTAAVA